MEIKNGKNRKTEEGEGGNDNFWHTEGVSGIVGTPETAGSRVGTYKVGISGEDSQRTDTLVFRGDTIEGISGKLVSQLIDETEKQLAYYDQQSQLLRARLKELKQISEITSTE